MTASPIDDGVVIVTGASSGIGADMVRQMAHRARAVVIVARRRERLEALADSLASARATIDVQPADLTDPSACTALVDTVLATHGRVDVLVNNAGMGDIGLFERADVQKTVRMIEVNVIGLTVLTRAVLPGMVDRGSGGVLNVSSGFGLTFMPGFSSYVGTKHYVTGFTDSLRTELSGTGVRVVQVCPGPVATEFEEVAENPLGQSVPGFVELSSGACASASIAAFDRDRALSVPGFAAWLMVHGGWWSPRVVVRMVLSLVGRSMRSQLTAQSSG